MLKSRKTVLNRAKTLNFLKKLESNPVGAKTLYIPAGAFLNRIEELLKEIPETLPAEISVLAAASATGAVLFWGQSEKCLVVPPFPMTQDVFSTGYAIKPLCSQLEHDYNLGLMLVRLGSYAIGLCRGEKLIHSKVGTGLVHARHHQGGSSSMRFARHREKQIETFLTRVCGHAREILEPAERTMDYFVFGGSNSAILLLKKRCSFFDKFNSRGLPPLLDLPEPRQAILVEAIERVWSSTVFEWRETEPIS